MYVAMQIKSYFIFMLVLLDKTVKQLFLFIAFLQSTQDIKRVISKKDGCAYLKQVPSIDGSLELI
jgi:hypothetical protein